jgi:hypothetical protein
MLHCLFWRFRRHGCSAGIFLLLNIGTITQNGAGIPMADIAFAIEFYLFGKSSSYFAQSIFDRACRN